MASDNVRDLDSSNVLNTTEKDLNKCISERKLAIESWQEKGESLCNKLNELLHSDKIWVLPQFGMKTPGCSALKSSKIEYLHQVQEAEENLCRIVGLFSDAVRALDAFDAFDASVDCQVEAVALESSSSLVPSASSELFQTKMDELKRTRVMFTDTQKGILVDMCKLNGVDETYKTVLELGGNWRKLQKHQLRDWVQRSDNPKRLPGRKVHLEFEHDVLDKVMLTVVQECIGVVGAKLIEKIVISVIYNYNILVAVCKETQKEWEVG